MQFFDNKCNKTKKYIKKMKLLTVLSKNKNNHSKNLNVPQCDAMV